jgi:hypothetical protein
VPQAQEVRRIYHTWEKWECYPAGFYENQAPDGMAAGAALKAYAVFLRDTPRFERALERVINEWKNSCEHYLSNENMNRIAWLGQASMCIETRIPACFRGGFNTLKPQEQATANAAALKWLNVWLERRGEPTLTMEEAGPKTKMDLY